MSGMMLLVVLVFALISLAVAQPNIIDVVTQDGHKLWSELKQTGGCTVCRRQECASACLSVCLSVCISNPP